MDENGQENTSTQSPVDESQITLSGLLYGPSPLNSSENVPISGISVEIHGLFENSSGGSFNSGSHGQFKAALTPGKYRLIFTDVNNKYFHPPITMSFAENKDLPIEM